MAAADVAVVAPCSSVGPDISPGDPSIRREIETKEEPMSNSPALSELSVLMRPDDDEAEMGQWARENLAMPDMNFDGTLEADCSACDHDVKPGITSASSHASLEQSMLTDSMGIVSLKQEASALKGEEFADWERLQTGAGENDFRYLIDGFCSGSGHLFASKLEDGETTDDLAVSGGIVVDAEGVVRGIDPCELLPESGLDLSLDALDGGEVHDTEIGDDAMLLAEITMGGSDDNMGSSMLMMGEEERNDSNGETSGRENQDGENGSAEVQGGKGGKMVQGRRKMKVDWTPELHRRFVQAVEQLGVEKAIPSRILELMGVQCLTRHNIASHLQKYRSHRRHLIAREAEAATWHHRRPVDPACWTRMRRDGTAWVSLHHAPPPPIQPRPAVGLPPLQPHPPPMGHPVPHPPPMMPPTHPVGMPLLVWGHPTMDYSSAHMWQHPPPMAPHGAWHGPDGSVWQYPTAPVDAWGHPPSAVTGTPCYPPAMMRPAVPPASGSHVGPLAAAAAAAANSIDSYFLDDNMPITIFPADDFDLFMDPSSTASASDDSPQPKGILENAISEVLSNPWTPLPLGLKPPSMDGVMAELQRQGISTSQASASA